ncbi:MAG: hypothetical protein ABIE94_05170 [archaeon]
MKRAQAALEFLTTYGWAFLVILVMIGALAYFGVLDPQNRLPEKCFVGPGFGCTDQTGDSTANVIKVKVTNNLGSMATVSQITVDSAEPDCIGGVFAWGEAIPFDWDPNEIHELWIYPPLPGCDLVAGDRAQATFTITYTKQGSTYVKTASGEVSVRVQ